MAATPITLWRNYNGQDLILTNDYKAGEPFPTIEDIGWETPSGKRFKEWNTSVDGSGIAFQPGDLSDDTYWDQYMAIWEEISVNTYLTTDTELTSVADAIRTKGGTSSPLVYPTGFVSAINNISTGTDVSDTTATANDVLSGTYFYTAAGVKTQGNITTQAAQTITPTTTNQTIAAGKYLTGAQTIAGDTNLVAANIADGVSIFGVSGTHSGGGIDRAPSLIDGTVTSFEDSTITNIKSFAFYHQFNLTTASFPQCSKIERYAFACCSSLTTISFPKCSYIGASAFDSCYNLTTVSFSQCSLIDVAAFQKCTNLTTASFPQCSWIGAQAFYNCYKLTTISFPQCSWIGSYAFSNCSSLTTANFPQCSQIGSQAFQSCYKLTTISFPKCSYIGASAFYNCFSLTTASFPQCSWIGSYAFAYCSSLTTISFPKCSYISTTAFRCCYNLTTASFPYCSYIGNYAFSQCYNLKSLYLTSTSLVSLAGSNAFNSTPIGGYSASAGVYGKIYVPSSMLASYKTATNWTYFSNRMVRV